MDKPVCNFSLCAEALISDSLCLAESPVDGYGLFVTSRIKKGVNIHPTHARDVEIGWINLTPNYKYNHSKINENCKMVTENNTKFLVSLRDLSVGEEIFVDYAKDLDLEQPIDGWVE